MPATITLAVEVAADPAAAFDALAEELARRGYDKSRMTVWERGRVARLEWPASEWESGRALEIRFERAGDGTRITVEHTGVGAPLEEFTGGADEAAPEVIAWFVEAAVAPSLGAAESEAFADWIVNRFARQPTGARARTTYADPEMHRPGFALVLDALALGPGDHLLELGCGGGAFLQDALATGCTAVGLDHSEEMVQLTERQNARAVAEGRLQVMRGDAAALPFGEDTFTAVASAYVFFFLPDPAAVLAEAVRVLRPAGRLALVTTSEEMRGTPAAPEPMASRCRFYQDEDLEQLARDAGFAEAAVTRPHYGGQLLVARKG